MYYQLHMQLEQRGRKIVYLLHHKWEKTCALKDLDFMPIVGKAKKRRKDVIMRNIDSITTYKMEVLKVDPKSQSLLPVKCDFWEISITTSNLCCYPVGDRKVQGTDDRICGLVLCIGCNVEEENRVRCKQHFGNVMTCLPCNKKANPDEGIHSNSTSSDSPDIFIPNYYEIFTSIKALGFDLDQCNFHWFSILKHRVKKEIKAKGKKCERLCETKILLLKKGYQT